GIVRKRHAALWILVVAVTAPLVGDFNCSSPEQDCQHQTQHIAIPAIANALEMLFQALSRHFVAIGVLMPDIVHDLPGDISRGVEYRLSLFYKDQVEALFSSVEHLGKSV